MPFENPTARVVLIIAIAGRVKLGDVMCGVDGRDVIGEPVSVLRSLLLGHEGSSVVLTFARAVEGDAEGVEGATEIGTTVIAKFDVELVRGSPEYFARMEQSRRCGPSPPTLALVSRQIGLRLWQSPILNCRSSLSPLPGTRPRCRICATN